MIRGEKNEMSVIGEVVDYDTFILSNLARSDSDNDMLAIRQNV